MTNWNDGGVTLQSLNDSIAIHFIAIQIKGVQKNVPLFSTAPFLSRANQYLLFENPQRAPSIHIIANQIMFYSQYILARKGPLGKIWLAAHFEKKLTKSQVFATDITESVQAIVNPTVPLALRVSGHLMLGIVRIYSDKVRYLSADCRDAMTRINLAFKVQTSRVDIEEGNSGKIDDANYALLPIEDDDQSHQLAYQRKVVRTIPKLDESEVTSFFAVGDIELLRNDLSRQSIQSRRSVATVDTRRSIDHSKIEEDILPAFDAQIGDNLFADTNFEMYEPFELTQDMSMDKETTAAPAVVDTEQFDFQPVVTTVQKVKANKTKRRKVEVRFKCVGQFLIAHSSRRAFTCVDQRPCRDSG